jgi:hypothetical protein
MTVKNVIFMENNIIKLKPFIKMGAEKLREEILELVKNADAKLLRMFAALGEVYEDEETVLEDTPMNPKYEGMTAEDIKLRLDESRKQYEKGEVHTIDEVRTMIKGKK